MAYGFLPPILPVRIMLFRLRLLLQLIEQLPACGGRQRQDPRRYRHHLKGNASLRNIHSVHTDDIELMWSRQRRREDNQNDKALNEGG